MTAGVISRSTLPLGLTEHPALCLQMRAWPSYRGTEEALTNVARYAPHSVTTVTLCYLRGRTRLSIKDDGAGPADRDGPQPSLTLADAGRGQGLAGMRERIT